MAKKTKKQIEAEQQQTLSTMMDDKQFETAEDLLEQTVMQLVFNEPFYANLIMNMNRQFTTALPTAGVNVTDRVNLYVNPYFFAALSLPARVDLLKHEAHHVINNHFVRFRDLEPKILEPNESITKDKITGEEIVKRFNKKMEDMTKASILNQAADLAINEYLPNLPKQVKMFNPDGSVVTVPTTIKDENGNDIANPDPNAGKPNEAKLCFVSEFKKQYQGMNHEQNMEYYYEFLKKQHEDDKKNGKSGETGFMVLDDHSLWHDSDATEDQITETVKNVVNKAVEQTSEAQMGKLPGDVKAAIEALNHVPLDWRSHLQRFVSRASESLLISTRKKRNRRYGIIYPGAKVEPKLHLAVAIDTSGSVDDESLTQFLAEIKRIQSLGVDVTMLQCDSRLQCVEKFDPRKPIKVHGRGGTAFKPVFDELEKNHDVDALIYFTDGECWGEDIKTPKFPVLWALNPPFHTQYLPKWYNNGTKAAQSVKIEIKKKVKR